MGRGGRSDARDKLAAPAVLADDFDGGPSQKWVVCRTQFAKNIQRVIIVTPDQLADGFMRGRRLRFVGQFARLGDHVVLKRSTPSVSAAVRRPSTSM